jgi:vanillate O-demethylase monooxygenase subunit
VIGERSTLSRRTDEVAIAFEDRCPHRHAPLSLARADGDDLRCTSNDAR